MNCLENKEKEKISIQLLLYIFDTNFLYFFVFQAIQASLPIDLGQERSQDPSKKIKIKGPSTELEQVPVVFMWEFEELRGSYLWGLNICARQEDR